MSSLASWAPAACLAAALAFSGSTQAQQAGEYDGTTQDGNPVTIIVAMDSGTGNFEMQHVEMSFTLICQKSLESLSEEWGISYADGFDIRNHKFSYVVAYTDDYLPFEFRFSGKTSVSGTVARSESDFNPAFYSGRPKKVQGCDSSQSFMATFTGAAKLPPGKPGTVLIKGRDFQTVRRLPAKLR